MRSILCALLAASFLPSLGAEEVEPGRLIRRTAWIRLEVVNGRISSPGLGRAPNRTLTAENGDGKESLDIQPIADEPGFIYRYHQADRELRVEFRGQRSFYLCDKSNGLSVTFDQTHGRQLQLTIDEGVAPVRQIAAPSLWQLLAFSEEAREYLVPRLEALNPGWGLIQQTCEIREQSFALVESNWQQDHRRWRMAVENLVSADYQQRQAADTQLRAGGAASAGFLQTVDRSQLSREQSRRVARIIAAATSRRDVPSSVAYRWIYDPIVWSRMLTADDSSQRQLAADHLAELLGRPVAFEANARPAIRQAQILKLDETLLRR